MGFTFAQATLMETTEGWRDAESRNLSQQNRARTGDLGSAEEEEEEVNGHSPGGPAVSPSSHLISSRALSYCP